MFIYNISLIGLFWALFQIININFKTLYSFNDFRFNSFFIFFFSIIFFSIAGIPPFIGFFSKLLILVQLINSNFVFLFIFFFVLLFFGLYFYLQNIKFLHNYSYSKIFYNFDFIIRSPIHFNYFAPLLIFFLIFGIFLIDDLYFFFYWLLY